MLKSLSPTGRSLVSQEYLGGSQKDIPDLDTHAVVVDSDFGLTEIESAAFAAMDKFAAGDTRMDAFCAPKFHRALPISRRTASDSGFWHYLALAVLPSFVRHRWGADKPVTRERFLGSLIRNGVGRLWWGAELTVRPDADDPYELTRLLFLSSASQDLYEALLGRTFGHHLTTSEAFLRVLHPESGNVIQKVARNFNHVLTTRVPEALSLEEAIGLVKEVKELTITE